MGVEARLNGWKIIGGMGVSTGSGWEKTWVEVRVGGLGLLLVGMRRNEMKNKDEKIGKKHF